MFHSDYRFYNQLFQCKLPRHAIMPNLPVVRHFTLKKLIVKNC